MRKANNNLNKIIAQEKGRTRVSTKEFAPTKTQAQFVPETDVNNIMRKYKTTGELMHQNRKQGVYADLSDFPDYQQSLDRIIRANDAFAALPSNLRLRFQNDPSQLLTFLSNPQNYDEGVTLGLFDKPIEKMEQQNQNDSNENINAPKTTKQKTKDPIPKPPDEL